MRVPVSLAGSPPARANSSFPRRRESSRRPQGFTLIEILVAVAILAVALAAVQRAGSLATDGARETRARLAATWAASNRVAELRAGTQFPPAASNRLTVEQAGLALVIDETVADTANPTIRRVSLSVSDAREPGRVLANLTAFVGRP